MSRTASPRPHATHVEPNRRRSRVGTASLLLGLVLSASCTEDKKAGLIVAIQSDMAIPKDVDSVEIEVSSYGNEVFDRFYEIGKDKLNIPGTLTLLPPDDTATPVTIRVISYKDEEPLTLRRVVTTVPADREALLRMEIDWLCRGQVKREGDEIVSTCGDGTSCVAGECVSDDVDASGLDDFTSGDVFGGSNEDGQSLCFDTAPCFARNASAADFGLNTKDCTFNLDQSVSIDGEAADLDPDTLNFAFETAQDGICGDWGCFVPLARDEQSGFWIDGSTVHLPKAACDELGDVDLVLSTACAVRTPNIPPCGDWTGLDGSEITVPIDDLPPASTGGGGGGTGGGSPSGGSGGANTGGTGTGGTSTGGGSTGGSGGTGGASTLAGFTWLEQFGSTQTGNEETVGIAVSGANVYVAFNTSAGISGQTHAGGMDYAIKKYDANGGLVWAYQFGTPQNEQVTDIAVDGSGNVLVSGYTASGFLGPNAGGTDAFVQKLDPSGAQIWGIQFGSGANDMALSVSADSTGAVLISGSTAGQLAGQANQGGEDAFVQKRDATGAVLWTDQFGSSLNESAAAVAVNVADAVDEVFIAGSTSGALPGQTSNGGLDAYVRLYSSGGTPAQTLQFGTVGNDTTTGLVLDSSGDAFVVGNTVGDFPGRANAGGLDVFVQKVNGSELYTMWNRQFGTAANDEASSVAMNAQDELLVAGSTVGTFPGQTGQGALDGYVRKLDPTTGGEVFTFQFGTSENDYVTGIVDDGSGTVYVTGDTVGLLEAIHVDTGALDAFVGRLESTDSTDKFVELSAGMAHTCARRESGAVTCWGSGSGTVTPGSYTHVSAGAGHTCGLQADGTAVCWGDNGSGQCTVPAGKLFTSISAGSQFTCGVEKSTNASIICWGSNVNGIQSPPLGKYYDVSSGDSFACARAQADGAIACWGNPSLMFPPGGAPSKVEGGMNHACALFGTNMSCWGDNPYGQTSVPGSSYADVSAGQYHSCGVEAGVNITCWGDDAFQQSDGTHPGDYVAVAAGGYHTCGLKQSGAVACWGDASLGATNSP